MRQMRNLLIPLNATANLKSILFWEPGSNEAPLFHELEVTTLIWEVLVWQTI